MKIINIDAAHPIDEKEIIPTIRISIRRQARPKTVEQGKKRSVDQALELYDALYESLPAGTWDELRKLMG